jgi:hypothetical protein
MSDEIKEHILERLNDSIYYKFPLTSGEKRVLLDLITNLQEENERLNTELNAYKDEFCKDTIKEYELVMEQEDYKSRIDKAIEYIEEHNVPYTSYLGKKRQVNKLEIKDKEYDELLNILYGGDEN